MKNLIEGLETRKLLSSVDVISLDHDDLHPRGAQGDYQIGGRWTSTASGSTGSTGSPAILTWGLVNDGLSIPGFNGEPTSPSNLISRLNTKYGSQATWLPLFQSVFDRWSSFTGITYVYQPTDDDAAFGGASGALGVRADLRIGGHTIDGGFNVLAYNFYPGTNNGGDMVIDTSEFLSGGVFVSTSGNSRTFRNTIAHEHGHGIGLAHVIPLSNTKLMEPQLSTAFDGPQFDDILAAQSLYGDANEKNGRNNTAPTATDLGTLANGTNTTLVQWNSISSTADTDYFKFTVPAGKSVSFTLQPDGTTYQQGPQNGTATSFNAGAQGNLNMALYDTDGTTVLQVANTSAIGVAETLSNLNLAAGSYYVRVTMTSGSTQMYKLLSTVTSSLVTPSSPDLLAASDSGLSGSDDITSDNTPTFFGTATPNTLVQILDGLTVVGSATSNGAGDWSITTSALADAVHTISARTSDGVLFSPNSTALSVTIDTVAPGQPVNPRVAAADDSGASDSDGVTNINTPRFSGTADANVTVRILNGASELITVAASGDFVSGNVTALADGSYILAAEAIDVAGNVSAPSNFAVVIDTIAPSITSSTYDREVTQDVTLSFSEAVAGSVDLGDLTLTNTTTAGTVAAASLTPSGDGLSTVVDFGALLVNGRYVLTMPSAAVSDLAGNALSSALSLEFVQVAGDANGNGTVNFDDLLILAQNYGLTGKTFSEGNFDYSAGGSVDFADLLLLAQNYGLSLFQSQNVIGAKTQTKRRSNQSEVLT
jgi:hypothetical protein